MAKIHELIPVESDRAAQAKTIVDEAVNTFAKKTDHFLGFVKTTVMFDETRQGENTTDIKELVDTVDGKLDHVWGALIPAIDVALTKENSNTSTEARADVIVNGVVILKSVPTTGLLNLEKQIAKLRDLYSAIPTLPPAIAWTVDAAAQLDGAKIAVNPAETLKTEKQMKVLTLAPATDKHPAQVEKYTLDVNVAKVTTVHRSGMISPAEKAKMLQRIADLATAVKEARQRANMAEVLPFNVAGLIRDFIHG